MDDRWRRIAACVLAAGLLAAPQTGCALFVMAGKMFFGDPLMTPVFAQRTGVDLEKSDKKILVICTTSQAVKLELPAVDYDLMDFVSRRLRSHGIDTVHRDRVSGWLNENGGEWGHPDEIAAQCDADYIVHIDIQTFSLKDRNSPGLLQGQVEGIMRGYEALTEDGSRFTMEVFAEGFKSTYPRHNPVSHDQMSPRAFQQEFVKRLGVQLGQMLHSFRYSDTID